MTNFSVNKGIVHQTLCVNISQQSNIVERKHDCNIPKIIYNI